jgi:pimeloyl-ACP methyl ester carboxylesterase
MIPFTDFGGAGQKLIFLHANGYPPGCYCPLLEQLAREYRVLAMHLRPLWPDSRPEELQDWQPLSDDLIRFLDEQKLERAIVVGHSMGGIIALRSALQHPERFRAQVLLDPVLFPPYFIVAWNIFRALGLGYRLHPLIRVTQNRRREFDDLDRLFKGYRRRSNFKYMDDAALRTYIEGMTCPAADGGYRLCYSAEWEIQIYYCGVWRDIELWRGLSNLKVPTAILRGAETDTFYESTGRRVEKVNPAIRVETIQKATHLVPLEHPQAIFERIQDFLKENS